MNKLIFYLTVFSFILLNQTLAQNPPISPKWVFEPWVWEDSANTQKATLRLKNDYLNRGIPVGAVIIDSPWEGAESGLYNETKNNGYNTFQFDTGKFNHPDSVKEFINDSLYHKGIHVILWITGIIDSCCKLYDTAKNDSFFVNNGARTNWWKGSGRASHIDFFNDSALTFWNNLMDRIFLNDYKIDGWKVDESDSYLNTPIITAEGSKTKEQYSIEYYSKMYEHINSERGGNGIIMARPYCEETRQIPYKFAPVSVNTAGWVGDQEHTWGGYGLERAIKTIFISADMGYAVLGSDIGGGGYSGPASQDTNLFIRWTQFGSLVPLMENGGKYNYQHQPWRFGNTAESIYKYYANLHHELVPYLYSHDIEANRTGASIIRPVGIGLSDWETKKLEYKLGDNLFVSTIYDENNQNSKTIYFPEGSSWIDYWNDNNIYQGGTPATLNYSPNQYPVFIRSGAIIPLNVDDTVTHHGSSVSKDYLTLLIYPDGLSSFQYNTDPSNSTTITCNGNGSNYTISFSKSTDSLIIRLKNNIEPENVHLNGGVNLVKYNSFSGFESASSGSGWFQGKINDNENVYTWIKFSNPADTVYVINSCSLDLNPANYELSNLDEGSKYYVDRDFTLITIPDEYKGSYMIKTANDDKNKKIDFHFNVCSSEDIYIAYDHRLSPPLWLSNNYVLDTGKTISVSDVYMEYFNIWKGKETAQPGIDTLGDNDGNDNSAMYIVFYKPIETLPVNIKVFLQGPYDNNVHIMKTDINSILPFSDPYSQNESVGSIPSGIVDWILVELRSDVNTIVKTRAAFLMNDGSIHDIDGSDHINFSEVSGGDYYIVIKHRNHLAVMSANTVSLPNSSDYDFTTGNDKYYGGSSGAIQLETGVWGMIAGDANSDGSIDAVDKNNIWRVENGTTWSYTKYSDFNLDGNLDAVDKNNFWRPNNGLSSQVP